MSLIFYPITEYDQLYGTRGKAAIPHRLGITNFKIAYTIDTISGCRNTNRPNVWQDMGLTTDASFDLDIMDGNAICFWIRAQDFVGHNKETTVVVHVDSSPPEIPYLWLERDGEVDLAIHNTINFQDMKYVLIRSICTYYVLVSV